MTPDVLFHLGAGSVSLVSGVLALISRKGAPLHRAAGTVFFIALMTTAASGVYLGFARSNINNAIAGVMTLYLLATAWMTVKRGEGETGLFERGALLFAAAGAVIGFYFAFAAVRAGTAMMGGVPYFTIASIAAFAAVLDLTVVLRGGVSGRQRIARHLWRMNLGFAAAVGSFFPGQLQFFPEFIQQTKPHILLFIPFFAVVGLMFFWLIRVLFTNWINTSAVKAQP